MAPDKEKFVALIRENRKIIFKICNSYCSDKEDRDDLAQEIIFNLWKSFAAFTPDYKFSTWMYRIGLNVAISYYRKETRSLQFSPYAESLIVFEDETGYQAEKESNLNRLQQFIFELNEIDKSIMLLYLDDKNYKEIAEITGITESNVGTKISRIKDKLKSKFFTQ